MIDLDSAAAIATARLETWIASDAGGGATMEPLTWRDPDVWPNVLVQARDSVRNPDSVGLRVRRGSREGTIVLFRGGWLDETFIDFATDLDPTVKAHGVEADLTLPMFTEILDTFLEQFQTGATLNSPVPVATTPGAPAAMARREQVHAHVQLFDASNGGRTTSIGEGYRPHLRVDNGDLLGVEFASMERPLVPGRHAIVGVRLLYDIDYSELQKGKTFSIVEGSREVGTGVIL